MRSVVAARALDVRRASPPPFRRAAWAALAAAALLAIGLALLELAGARDCTVVLSGGAPPGRSMELAALLGGLYTVAWLATVTLAPPLGFTAATLWALGHVSRRLERTERRGRARETMQPEARETMQPEAGSVRDRSG